MGLVGQAATCPHAVSHSVAKNVDKSVRQHRRSAISGMTAFHLWTPLRVQAVSRGLARCRMLPSVRPLMQR
jgi:hypothetical protein